MYLEQCVCKAGFKQSISTNPRGVNDSPNCVACQNGQVC